jgi:hypothetical protein
MEYWAVPATGTVESNAAAPVMVMTGGEHPVNLRAAIPMPVLNLRKKIPMCQWAPAVSKCPSI